MESKAKYYFQIATTSGVPIYRQIIDQVKILIATKKLPKGEFLPSVRQVATELEINPMTASKAYSLLEKEGVLEFVRGQGMKVRESDLPGESLEQKENEIMPLLNEVVTKSRQLSLRPNRVIEMLKSVLKEKGNE